MALQILRRPGYLVHEAVKRMRDCRLNGRIRGYAPPVRSGTVLGVTPTSIRWPANIDYMQTRKGQTVRGTAAHLAH